MKDTVTITMDAVMAAVATSLLATAASNHDIQHAIANDINDGLPQPLITCQIVVEALENWHAVMINAAAEAMEEPLAN